MAAKVMTNLIIDYSVGGLKLQIYTLKYQIKKGTVRYYDIYGIPPKMMTHFPNIHAIVEIHHINHFGKEGVLYMP